jgi:hypothetical protein
LGGFDEGCVVAGVGTAAGVFDEGVEAVGGVLGGLFGRRGELVGEGRGRGRGAYIRHVRTEFKRLLVFDHPTDLLPERGETLQVDGEDERGFFDREALFGIDEFLAPVSFRRRQSFSPPTKREGWEGVEEKKKKDNALLALVLIPPRQLITPHQIPQRIVHAVRSVQVKREIEHVVERVGVVTALGGDSGTETAAEELVEGGEGGGRGREFAVRGGETSERQGGRRRTNGREEGGRKGGGGKS